jgi:uncharacterized protein (TIGR02217 family)
MAFHEVRFPTRISWGSASGPGYSTSIIQTGAGIEERISRWSEPLYRFDVAYGVKDLADMSDLISFFHARGGPAAGFRFLDFLDYSTASDHRGDPSFDDVTIGTGDGATQTFQLQKTYASGGNTRTRVIRKPIHGETIDAPYNLTANVRVGVNGSELLSGWSVDTTSGVVTITPAPAAGLEVTAGCYFDVPVRFSAELDEGLLQRVESHNVASVDSVPLVEVRETGVVNEELHFGGSFDHGTLTGDIQLSHQAATVHRWVDNSGASALLPDESSLPLGGPYFYLMNAGTSNTTLKDHTGLSTVGTVVPNQLLTVVLGLGAMSVPTWYIA